MPLIIYILSILLEQYKRLVDYYVSLFTLLHRNDNKDKNKNTEKMQYLTVYSRHISSHREQALGSCCLGSALLLLATYQSTYYLVTIIHEISITTFFSLYTSLSTSRAVFSLALYTLQIQQPLVYLIQLLRSL